MNTLTRFLFLAYVALAACAHQPGDDAGAMDRPIEFETSAQFYRALQSLEHELSDADYRRLTDAVGELRARDLEHVTHEDFHASLAGLSPNQIIEKAESL